MRSLVLLHHESRVVQGKKPESKITSLAVRPEEIPLTLGRGETVYVASERQLPDGGVEIQIFVGNSREPEASIPVASFQAPPEPPFELPNGRHVVDFRYIGDSNALAIVLAGGDIIIVNLEEELLPDQEKIDVVGSVESGVKAAAWSPDEELLILVTGEDNIVEMTKSFDVLTELPLYTQEFGQDKPVNVGWGAQSTQFHGSIGKAGRDAVAGLPAATRLTHSQAADANDEPASSDNTIRISWRGDGAFFVVSALFAEPAGSASQRRLRFYSREAVLQSTSEPTPGLEGSLAWQPSGSIIASSANHGRQIVFFERNGLRRYEFDLKEERPEWQCAIRQLAWNSDSTILAVWVERHHEVGSSSNIVQLWRRSNYHWYLKQSIEATTAMGEAALQSLVWNPEVALSLYLIAGKAFECHSYHWDTFAAEHAAPDDTGAVVVVDGSRLLFTPFRYQNVPPPMSTLVLHCPLGHTPVHVAFDRGSNTVAALMSDGHVNIWSWTFSKGNKSSVNHLGRIKCLGDTQDLRPKALTVSMDETGMMGDICLLCSGGSGQQDGLWNYRLDMSGSAAAITEHSRKYLLVTSLVIFANLDSVVVQDRQGKIVTVEGEQVAKFPEPCPVALRLDSARFLGLSQAGRLYCNERLLTTGCTSFALGGDFLIYTTLQHEIKFLLQRDLQTTHTEETPTPLFTQVAPAKNGVGEDEKKDTIYGRRVERGSRIVTVIPSTMSIVLQMPRGNLETISPRPLVLQQVRKALDAKDYREAFMTCRRHRIDINILCDHNYESFLRDLPIFIDQINDNEHLGLFISGLKNEDVTKTMYRSLIPSGSANKGDAATKVNAICQQLRQHLQNKDLVSFANAIMTSYVCQQPPDLESALRVITAVKPVDTSASEDAVHYIIFLADANRLYDVALGMYDFELVLAIAQNSQKDPREYLPFLRELRSLDKYYQRHRIDDHLKKYSKALQSLAATGEQRFEEALVYMQRHELFDEAVKYYNLQPERSKTVLDVRGDWLMRDDRCHEAALSYTLAGEPRKAMIAHQRALTWRELFDIAVTEQLSEEDMATLAEHVGDALKAKGRHAEAGRVFLDYAKDVKNAIIVLSDGNEFAEAIRIASLNGREDLVAEVVAPTVLEARDRLAEETEELKAQVQKQTSRLAELREKRLNDSSHFYGRLMPGDADDALANVDVQTEAGGSIATTQFTRYTVAPASTRTGTVKSGHSRKTARKQLRKAAGGAKGSIFEESYLLGSLSRTVSEGGRLPQLVAAVASLLRTMVRLSAVQSVLDSLESGESLIELAKSLEDAVTGLVAFCKETIDNVWEALGDAELHDLETAMLADADPDAAASAVLKRPEKPKLASFGHWQVGLLSLLAQGEVS